MTLGLILLRLEIGGGNPGGAVFSPMPKVSPGATAGGGAKGCGCCNGLNWLTGGWNTAGCCACCPAMTDPSTFMLGGGSGSIPGSPEGGGAETGGNGCGLADPNCPGFATVGCWICAGFWEAEGNEAPPRRGKVPGETAAPG